MSVLLQFLGYSFPTVRQSAAQALYIRLLEEEHDLDLSVEEAAIAGEPEAPGFSPPPRAPATGSVVPAKAVAEVLELVSVTPWGTDNEAILVDALRDVYAKLCFDLPTGGRSILVPKKPKAAERNKAKGSEAVYADLVRENHF